MIKNEVFNVYDRVDKAHLELMAAAFEADLQGLGADFGRGDFIKARLGVIYALLKYKIHNGWLPTPENINALPEPVRKFIHDLETNTDPARIVRENILIKDTCKALVIKLEEKEGVTEEWIEEKAVGTASDYPDIAFPNLIIIFKKLLKEAGIKVVKK
jgi:hypothetical protein